MTEDRLISLEEEIETAPKNFAVVGRALAEIRNQRLYKAEFSAFEAYCLQRLGYTRVRAHQLIEAYETANYLAQQGFIVKNERQARELARVPNEKQVEILRSLQARSIKLSTANIRREAESLYLGRQKHKRATPRSKPGSTALGPADEAAVAHLALHTGLSYAEIAELHNLGETAVRKFIKYDKAFLARSAEHKKKVIEDSRKVEFEEIKRRTSKM